MTASQFFTQPAPLCPVCESSGEEIYNGLKDELFHTPGEWNMKKCKNHACQTFWLDPTPHPDSIPLLYNNYTTHNDPEPITKIEKTGLRKFLDDIRQAILYKSLGYPNDFSNFKNSSLNLISFLHLGWRNEQLNQVLYVPFVKDGHLLDVGCGGGLGMITMKDRGWKVTGTDFDEQAINNARQKGFNVHLGDLGEINFPDNSFDAILLSHVIEHVPDPINLLKECKRILKPRGHLVALTPNTDSRGHNRFHQNWRGLEVPRHLQIFTPASLENIGKQAGFRVSQGRTCLQGIYYIWDASLAHEKTGNFDLPPVTKRQKIFAKLRLFIGGIKLHIKPGKEETALLYCQK